MTDDELRALGARLTLAEFRAILKAWAAANVPEYAYVSVLAHIADDVPDMVIPVASSSPR